MTVRFLLDENMSPRLLLALRRLHPEIDVLRVGEPDAPSFATPDPAILLFIEANQRVLITGNRVRMPVHVAAHRAAGRHH